MLVSSVLVDLLFLLENRFHRPVADRIERKYWSNEVRGVYAGHLDRLKKLGDPDEVLHKLVQMDPTGGSWVYRILIWVEHGEIDLDVVNFNEVREVIREFMERRVGEGWNYSSLDYKEMLGLVGAVTVNSTNIKYRNVEDMEGVKVLWVGDKGKLLKVEDIKVLGRLNIKGSYDERNLFLFFSSSGRIASVIVICFNEDTYELDLCYVNGDIIHADDYWVLRKTVGVNRLIRSFEEVMVEAAMRGKRLWDAVGVYGLNNIELIKKDILAVGGNESAPSVFYNVYRYIWAYMTNGSYKAGLCSKYADSPILSNGILIKDLTSYAVVTQDESMAFSLIPGFCYYSDYKDSQRLYRMIEALMVGKRSTVKPRIRDLLDKEIMFNRYARGELSMRDLLRNLTNSIHERKREKGGEAYVEFLLKNKETIPDPVMRLWEKYKQVFRL